MSSDNVLREAALLAERYQQRIDRQRNIIDRYDGFRKWVLKEVVDEIRTLATRLDEQANRPPEQHMEVKVVEDTFDRLYTLADEMELRGENPQGEGFVVPHTTEEAKD